jgi:hypothetical protein
VLAIEVDQPKNLLVIRYRGAIASNEVERGLEEVRAALTKLNIGFRLLGDLTELQSMDVSCASFLEKFMDLCSCDFLGCRINCLLTLLSDKQATLR